MNDELSGQLAAAGYTIPNTLQGKLTLVTDHESANLEGEMGLFELSVPAQDLRLHYGGEDGLLLAALSWQPDNLEWRGEVRIGGSVEALTIIDVGDIPITVLTMLGVPLVPNAAAYTPAGAEAAHIPMAFADGAISADEGFYTFLAPEDSPLVTLAENALMNKMRVWLNGQIAADETGWHNHFGLPILLESGTLFASLR